MWRTIQRSASRVSRSVWTSLVVLTVWSSALLLRPPVVQPLGSFRAFYRTRRFITTFIRALHLSLSWAGPIESTPPHPICTRSIIVLTFLAISFPLAFLPTTCTLSSSPHSCYMLRHLIPLDLIILIILGEEYKSRNSSLCSFLHSPVTLL
jgi:hypothetical protein